MAKNIEWLLAQNTQRAAMAGPRRQDRGGQGRALARRAWIARRSAERRLARMRLEVVGWVRLRRKGPPPRLGPLNQRRLVVSSSFEVVEVVEEPFDDATISLVEAVWAQENDERLMVEVFAAGRRRTRPTAVALPRDLERGILWGVNGL